MTDREFLIWIHERLELVHNENPLDDYMHTLRAIIRCTPVERVTPRCNTCNSLGELLVYMLAEQTKHDTPPILHQGKGEPPEFCEKS